MLGKAIWLRGMGLPERAALQKSHNGATSCVLPLDKGRACRRSRAGVEGPEGQFMKTYRLWGFSGLVAAASIAACSNQVSITAETAGPVSASSSGSSAVTTGSGASGPGGTGGATGTGGTTGAGGAGPASNKVVTAETDIGQYMSISVSPSANKKILDGPFFVTDVSCDSNASSWLNLDTVLGGDCSAPPDAHTKVLVVTGNPNTGQIHGIRLPILPGQALCGASGFYACTVLGFKPY